MLTGATGFVGGHVTRYLLSRGWVVNAIVRPSSNRERLKRQASEVAVHTHDGSAASLRSIVDSTRPDVVMHLATHFVAVHGADDIEPLIDANVRFATQLVDAMTSAGVRHFVNTGTAWQHMRDQPYLPVSLYAATKQAFESILTYYVDAASLRVITLVLHDTYGPDDPRKKLFWALDQADRNGTELALSPGEQLLDLVHVHDVVRAFEVAAERVLDPSFASGHERYAVSSGRQLSLRDVLAMYQRVVGRRLRVRWSGRPYREREVMIPWSSGAALPGWNPRVSLEEGLKTLGTVG